MSPLLQPHPLHRLKAVSAIRTCSRPRKATSGTSGVKGNIGVDSDTGVTHSLVTKPAHAAGERQAHALLHASKRRAFGDPGWVHTSDPRIATDR